MNSFQRFLNLTYRSGLNAATNAIILAGNFMRKNEKFAYLEGWASVLVNTLLFALKYWAGIASNSLAIIADAWHTLSDTISSAFVLIGAKASGKPPDEQHPFGHGRAELITAFIIGIFLAFIAYEFGRESIGKFVSRERANYGAFAVMATVLSIVLKEGLAQFAFWTYRKSGSKALSADGMHHRSDALSSAIVLVGIFLGRFFWWIDAALGLLIALFILHSSVKIVMETIDPLMGKVPDAQLIAQVNELCHAIGNRSIHAHHFHLHEYGDHSELTFHIVLPPDMTLKTAHELANSIEMSVREKYHIEATIHMESEGDEKDYTGEGIPQNPAC